MDLGAVWAAGLGTAGTAVVGLLGWLGTKASVAGKREEVEITTRGDEWQKIVSAVQTYADRRIAHQDAQLDRQGEKIDCLEGKVGALQVEVETTRSKYWKAIVYSRAWRARHPESIMIIEVPPEIEEDL